MSEFSDFIDCLYGVGSDPWSLTGGSDYSRCVRLRDYATCPERLGEYYVPAFYDKHAYWLSQVQEQSTVKAEDLGALWDAGTPALARTSALCQPNNRIFVLEHDSLIVPTGDECRALGNITAEELKALQPSVVYQAAMATGMPHSAMVWSGGKSLHMYLVAADPENWPERPPLLGDSKGLPGALVDELRQRQRAKSAAEKDGRYTRWYAWQHLLYLATGKFDQQVFHAAGQGGYVRTPGATRTQNGQQQRLLSVKAPITWQEHWDWLLAQVTPEVRQWVTNKASSGAQPLKKTPELREMLRLEVPGGWKDMVVRQVMQGGEHAEEQALTKQVMGVVAELHPTQRPPEILRRPCLEQGDWGDIRASFLWWVSFLTMNHLSIPWTTNHPQAPTHVGWVFTGSDWWWEDGSGKNHNIREIWKPGNEGGWDQRLESAEENLLLNYLLENKEEHDRLRTAWAATGFDGRSAPISKITGERIKLGASKKSTTEDRQKTNEDRYHYFLKELGTHVVRTSSQCVPYPSEWLAYDGQIWKVLSIEQVQVAAASALKVFPELTAKGDIKPTTWRLVEETIKFAYGHYEYEAADYRTEWKQREGCVVFPNGTLYLDTSSGTYEFKKDHFAPEDWAVSGMPYPYDHTVQTPHFDNYMATSFSNEQDRENILQFMGYVLDPHAAQKSWLMVVGDADSGKTTLQKLITRIVGGKDYVVAPNLDSMARDSYWAARLPTARIISIDEKTEVGHREQKQITALIKQITGDGQITCRQMNKNPFTVDISAKLIMTCNVRPDFKDDSDAFWKRLIIVRPSVPKQIDRNLLEKIEPEMAGVMPKLIAAWARMRAAGGFQRSAEQLAETADYREANSPLIEFFNEWMVAEEGACCYIKAVLETYNKVRDGGFKSENKFVIALRDTMKLSISRHTKADMQRMNVQHLPADKYMANSGYILRGYRCTHPHADIACGVPTVAPDLRGTQNDPTPMERPRPNNITPFLRV